MTAVLVVAAFVYGIVVGMYLAERRFDAIVRLMRVQLADALDRIRGGK